MITLIFQEQRTWDEIAPGTYDDPEPTREVVIPDSGALPVYSGETPKPPQKKFDYETKQYKVFCGVEIRPEGTRIPAIFVPSGPPDNSIAPTYINGLLWVAERTEWTYLSFCEVHEYETRRSGWKYSILGPYTLSEDLSRWLLDYFSTDESKVPLEKAKHTSIDDFVEIRD